MCNSFAVKKAEMHSVEAKETALARDFFFVVV
jgi:hypothetical protein